MRFKSKFLAFTLILNGCGWTSDVPKQSHFQPINLSCLKSTPIQLQKLFNGAYTASAVDTQQIKGIWTCLNFALTKFTDFTRGENLDRYQASELQTFANHYLPEGKTLNLNFIQSIFKLKMAIFGGDEHSISRAEIDVLKIRLTRFGEFILPLAPHLKTLLFPSQVKSEIARRNASVELKAFVLNFASLLNDSANPIQWTDIHDFVAELESYTKKGDKNALTTLREELPLLQYFKLLVVGGSENAIENNKWKPISESVSNLYDAVYLSTNRAELLDRLNFNIQSTEAEQARAVSGLVEKFKILKSDSNLVLHDQFVVMAERFAEVLVLNSFLFPRSQGGLAMKPFLSTPEMRRLAGRILDGVPGIKLNSAQQEPNLVNFSEDVFKLLDLAASIPLPKNEALTPLSLSSVRTYIDNIRPLFSKSSEGDFLIAGIDVLKSVFPLLTGQDPEHLLASDLKSFIGKALGGYLIWDGYANKESNDKIGATLDILIRAPTPDTISSDQIFSAFGRIQNLLTELKISSNIDWDHLKKLVEKSLKAKSILYQDSALSISSAEINHLAYLWTPFRMDKDLALALSDSEKLLANRPLPKLSINDIMTVVKLFSESPESKSRISVPLLQDLKVILSGGSRETISGNEYSKLAQSVSILYSRLIPKITALPRDFAPGLDSTTIRLFKSGFEALIETKVEPFKLSDAKNLAQELLKDGTYAIRGSTLDKLFFGIYTRILNKSHGIKPSSLSGLKLDPDKLKAFLPLLDSLVEQVEDVERAYQGLDLTSESLSRATLMGRLKHHSNIELIENVQPLLDGTVHLHHFPKRGGAHDQFFQFDLVYKTVVLSVMNWVIPFYKIEPDPLGHPLRLTVGDLTDLLTDINDLIHDLKLSFADSSPPKVAKARMRSMNLFTRVGNGDEYMDPLETVEFLTLTFGGKILLGRAKAMVFHECFPGVTHTGSITRIPYSCLSRVAFTPQYIKKLYGPIVPKFVEQYLNYTPEELETYRVSAFTGTRAGWTENGEMSVDDFESLVSLPHFLENLFERFDANDNDILNFSELMNAFPIFCREINVASGGKLKGSCIAGEKPKQIEAIYGYLIFHGHPPKGSEHGANIFRRVQSVVEILFWFRKWHRLDRNPEVRNALPPQLGRQDLLSIIANLSSSTEEAAASPIPPPDLLEEDDSSEPMPQAGAQLESR